MTHDIPVPETLWHGTTRRRADLVIAARELRPAPIGVKVLSLTGSRAVAAYFAEVSAACTDHDEIAPVVMRIDTAAASAAGIGFERFSDPVWDQAGDENACLWESEWCTMSAIPIGITGTIEPVEAHQIYQGPRRPPFGIPELSEGDEWRFVYTNWRGEIDERIVRGPVTLRVGSTPWHDVDQWLMRAYDLDRQAWREYAMADVIQGR